MTDAPIRVLDLFAGAGGFTRGFHEASDRFDTVMAVEWDIAAAASFAANFGADRVYPGAIQDWLAADGVPKDIDVIIGGPPCQGFSTLGKQDVEDERNFLWMQYAETIRRAKPKYFVVENVAAFSKSPQFAAFQELLRTDPVLSEYDTDWRILNSAHYGAPQARKRAVMIGHRRGLPFPGWPKPTHADAPMTVADAFAGIPAEALASKALPDRSMVFAGKVLAGPFNPKELHVGRDYTALSKSRFAAIPEGGSRKDLPWELRAECWKKHTTGAGDVMGRLHWGEPSVTIRTEFFKPEKGRYLHPVADRAITHREAAALQGFPDEHVFLGSKTAIARQIGNAVPIPLGKAIAGQIALAFSAGIATTDNQGSTDQE